MADERRKSRRVPVEMTAELLISDRNDGEALCDPVKGMVADLNGNGISLCLSSMVSDGKHLFYLVHENNDFDLMLRFTDNQSRRYNVTCQPVWFDREMDEEPMYYRLGLVFTNNEEKEHIRLLQQLAKGRDEKGLKAVLSDFFKKQLIRVS